MTNSRGQNVPPRRWVLEKLVNKSADWMIVGLLWFVFVLFVQPVRERVVAIWNVPRAQAEMGRRIDILSLRIETLLPPERVAEYDTLRSRVLHPCATGRVCRYNIRARRTEFGRVCGVPETLGRVVTDRHGLQHFVEKAQDGRRPRRIDGEWTDIPLSFVAPTDAPAGVAEFHLHLSYECNGEVVEESTPRLVFELIADPRPDGGNP